ncbi:MAG: Uma2 family endonuclease, partial [Okeania sp. SIO2F4]
MVDDLIILQMPPSLKMTEEQFFEFCQINRDLPIETNRFGELLIMSPAGSETGN